MKMKIYLSGSVKKGNADPRPENHYWSQFEERKIRNELGSDHVVLLNPARTKIRRNDYFANYGCDLYLVSVADVVLCDARTEKGIGIGAELMCCVFNRIPVITWAPRNSHYKRDHISDLNGEDLFNWVHPFVFGLSDYIVESLDEAIELLKIKMQSGHLEQRKPEVSEAIKYFRTQYPQDVIEQSFGDLD